MSKESFGIIAYKNNDNAVIVFEGMKNELLKLIDSIKEVLQKTDLQIVDLDKNEYDTLKFNAIELNKLVLPKLK